ncbi:carboxymuconolactone decarboxylase family protein [Nonomuraea sp. NEAU-A123]|uniref:carboxymuconolactone decarboxylase family protein n=1 Tax=Nonomuraea sp. NEAU-A123 TaxID=2839649 RepID=UPI001BE45E77|nr:carboxymuconolactone decarboxylase family protein [Nonomuraea sp. NEAU-A123]MBT2234231.1 carboxymuconolactone decarboxylase family protein [Nonomuraea sp. NEAU-A123]
MSRIALVEPPYEPEVGAQLESMMPTGVPPIGLFRMFAGNLPMTGAMHGWGRYELGRQLTLSMREREITIARTCARCRCEYEWGVHVSMFAERVGLTTAQIVSVTHGTPDDPCWESPRERLLIEAVDALHANCDIDDALWARLAEVIDDGQLLDLLLLCGWYHAISFAATAARVPHEPNTPRFADFAPAS